jgi:hypothetical protein
MCPNPTSFSNIWQNIKLAKKEAIYQQNLHPSCLKAVYSFKEA